MLVGQVNVLWPKFTKDRMAHRTKTTKTALSTMRAVSFFSFVFAICEPVTQTGKWVLKQIRDKRFRIGERSFTTYMLTPREVEYYTLLAEGDALQVWSVYYPGHLIVMFFCC
jgi:hypothetical protein